MNNSINNSDDFSHQVTIRKYSNGSMSIHARKMGDLDTMEKVNKIIFSPSNIHKMNGWEIGREGLVGVDIVLAGLSRKGSEDVKRALVGKYRNLSKNVLNKK